MGGSLINQINIYIIFTVPEPGINKNDLFDYNLYNLKYFNTIYNRANKLRDDITSYSELPVQKQKQILQTEIINIKGYQKHIPDILIIESATILPLSNTYKKSTNNTI